MLIPTPDGSEGGSGGSVKSIIGSGGNFRGYFPPPSPGNSCSLAMLLNALLYSFSSKFTSVFSGGACSFSVSW